jgi:hypothetical protein
LLVSAEAISSYVEMSLSAESAYPIIELDTGTLKGIIREAGLNVDEFIELL